MLTIGFATEKAEAKSVLPKKSKTSVALRGDSSENQKSEKIFFWGGKSSKKSDIPGVTTENMGEKPKKSNPVTEFFSNIGKKKKTSQEIKLPSEKASENSTQRSVENGFRIRKFGEPMNEKPPFAPSYGIDRTSEIVSDTSVFPDSVILEDAPSSEPIVISSNGAVSQQATKTESDIILEDVQNVENGEIITGVEDKEIPPVPFSLSNLKTAPERMTEISEEKRNVSGLSAPEYESDLEGWNQEIPQLEFMEEEDALPLLNVSPQRLASPPEALDFEISALQEGIDSQSQYEYSDSSATFAEVKPRYGSAVSVDSVFQARQMKMSGVETEREEMEIKTQAPENLVVGMEASFIIEVQNNSETPSEGSSIEIAIPDWFSVRSASVERGSTVITPNSMVSGQRCVWNLGLLSPNTKESLILKVIPQRSASADLRISWGNQKAEVQAVTANLPKLEMRIDSVQTVEEGQSVPLEICVKNVGNCVARDIAIQLETKGCSEKEYFVPGIRSLLPGDAETVQVIVTPATRGKIQYCAEALIQNQCFASVEDHITVEYLDLNVEIPKVEKVYAGTDVEVPIKITNYGNATAKKVRVFLKLPPQAHVIRMEPNVLYQEPTPNQLVLELNDIPSRQTETFRLLLQPKEEGELTIPCAIQANSRTAMETIIPLNVEGVASMRMELKFPTRILSTSEWSACEVTVKNTGSRTITDGKLLIFFSEGIEPVQTMAFSSKISEGGVVSFDVATLKPGEEHTFQVQAQVAQPGNYPIRCQLKSASSGLDLIQQETAIYR